MSCQALIDDCSFLHGNIWLCLSCASVMCPQVKSPRIHTSPGQHHSLKQRGNRTTPARKGKYESAVGFSDDRSSQGINAPTARTESSPAQLRATGSNKREVTTPPSLGTNRAGSLSPDDMRTHIENIEIQIASQTNLLESQLEILQSLAKPSDVSENALLTIVEVLFPITLIVRSYH